MDTMAEHATPQDLAEHMVNLLIRNPQPDDVAERFAHIMATLKDDLHKHSLTAYQVCDATFKKLAHKQATKQEAA
jgi:hypothetical protein